MLYYILLVTAFKVSQNFFSLRRIPIIDNIKWFKSVKFYFIPF